MATRFTLLDTNFVLGTFGDDEIAGRLDDEFIATFTGDDVIDGAGGTDTIVTGRGRDTIVYDAASLGGDGTDQLADWSVADDRFLLDAEDFGVKDTLNVVNALAEDLPAEGANVIVLQNADDDGNPETVFNARSAARLIGEEVEEEGAGFFVYFNSALGVNRLVFSENLADGEADFTVLAAINGTINEAAIAELADFTADNFAFRGSLLQGDQFANALEGFGGDDTIIGGRGEDTLTGNGGDDTQFGNQDNDVLLGGDGNDTQDGGIGDDEIVGDAGDDTQLGARGNDVLNGGEGNDNQFGNQDNDVLDGGAGDDRQFAGIGDDLVLGGEGSDEQFGAAGNDTLDGGSGQDTLTGGIGEDLFAFTGDPFDGADVSAPGRQIIGNEDFIEDFNFTDDAFFLDTSEGGFEVEGDVFFQSLDANAEGAGIVDGVNVVILQNSDNDGDPETPFLAGTAAGQIADLVEEDGAGFFVYFNSVLEVNRLVYSENLNDAEADLKIVARLDDATGADAVDALQEFGAQNFTFGGAEDLLA